MSEMFLNLILMNSIILIFMKHPISCGMTLLMQTLLMVLLTGMLNYYFWYSYILFLIMIGGMLILFIYMTSIASNEKFKFNFKIMILMIILITVNFFIPNEILESTNSFNSNLPLMKYLNYPNIMIMIMMINYLFLTLIIVVKITNLTYGPLRQKL